MIRCLVAGFLRPAFLATDLRFRAVFLGAAVFFGAALFFAAFFGAFRFFAVLIFLRAGFVGFLILLFFFVAIGAV
jgi:hypothetical protein